MAMFTQYTVVTRTNAPGVPGGFQWMAVFGNGTNQMIANGNANPATVLNQLASLGWTLVAVGDLGNGGADEMILGK